MKLRPIKHLLLPLLALGVTCALAASVQAEVRQSQRSGGTALSLQINFGTTPRWVGVPGTSVREIRQNDRTDYDMFRYGRHYYAYNHHNNRWYISRRWRGQFSLIANHSVPRELRRIPRDHWRNYPTGWEDRDYRRSGGTSGSFQVTFGSAPRWTGISGTRVEVVSVAQRPDYDVFRYGGTYYAYNSNQWYSSSRETGKFTVIADRSVPSELSKVPREHWRNYPAGWGNENGTPPGLLKKGGNPPGQDKKNRDPRSSNSGR